MDDQHEQDLSEMILLVEQLRSDNERLTQTIKDAKAAKLVADDAKAIAVEVKAVADEAKEVATQEKVVADEAKALAIAAKVVADDAKAVADEAKALAVAAKTVADEAKTVAAEEKVIADEAKALAIAAKVLADKAKAVTARENKRDRAWSMSFQRALLPPRLPTNRETVGQPLRSALRDQHFLRQAVRIWPEMSEQSVGASRESLRDKANRILGDVAALVRPLVKIADGPNIRDYGRSRITPLCVIAATCEQMVSPGRDVLFRDGCPIPVVFDAYV
jgi:hypothetical protein